MKTLIEFLAGLVGVLITLVLGLCLLIAVVLFIPVFIIALPIMMVVGMIKTIKDGDDSKVDG